MVHIVGCAVDWLSHDKKLFCVLIHPDCLSERGMIVQELI
jgi:hypothetical protein